MGCRIAWDEDDVLVGLFAFDAASSVPVCGAWHLLRWPGELELITDDGFVGDCGRVFTCTLLALVFGLACITLLQSG